MASDLGVQIEFKAIDKVSAELKKIVSQFDKFDKCIKMAIPTLNKMNTILNGSNSAFKKVRDTMSSINATFKKTTKIISQTGNVTQKFTKSLNSNSAFKKVNDATKSINATFKKTTKTISQTGNATRKFTESLRDKRKAFDDLNPRLSRYFGGIGGISVKLNGLTAATTLAVTGIKQFSSFLSEAVRSAGDVEVAVQKLSSITGKSGNALLGMKQIAIDVGEATKFTTQDMLEAQKNLGQMGLITSDTTAEIIRARTETTAYYAVATDRTIQEASADIGAGVASLGLTATEVGDKMYYLANNSLMAYDEMRGVFSKFGGLVKVNNQSTDSLLALTGAYREITKSTNIASTHITSFGTSLIAVHKSAKKMGEMQTIANAIGKTDVIYNAKGEMRDMLDIIDDLHAGYEELGYSQADINTSLSTMFNKTAVSVYQGAIAKGITEIREQAEKIGTESVGVVDKAAEEMGNTFNGLVERIKGKFDNIKTAIGESLMDGAKDGLKNLLDTLDELDVATISVAIGSLGDTVFEMFNMAVPLINDIVMPLVSSVLNLFGSASRLFSMVISKLKPIISIASTFIIGFIDTITTIVNFIITNEPLVVGAILSIGAVVLVSLIPSFVSLIPVLVTTTSTFIAMGIAFMMSPFGLLIIAVAGLTAGFIALSGGLDRLIDPVGAASKNFDTLYEKSQKATEGLAFFESIELGTERHFTEAMVSDMGLLGDKIDEIKGKFPELGIEMEEIANSNILNASEKVNMLNDALQQFKDVNLNFTFKEQKAALLDFSTANRTTVADIFRSQKKIDTYLEKGIDNLSSAQKLKLERHQKDIAILQSRFKMESQKLLDMGIDASMIDKQMNSITNRTYGAKGFFEVDLGAGNQAFKHSLTAITEQLYSEIGKVEIEPTISDGAVAEMGDKIAENTNGQVLTPTVEPKIDFKAVQESYKSMFDEINSQMNLDVKWAEYQEESAVRVNQIKAEGLNELIELKRQEIEVLDGNIELENELVDLLIKKKEVMGELDPHKFVQQLADATFEQYEILSKDVEKLVGLEDKIVAKRQSIYDKQAKEIEKYQNSVIQSQQKIDAYREKWFDKWEQDIEKLQDKINGLTDKIAGKQAELSEKLKVKGTIVRSEILSDEGFSQYSTLDNIKDQVFDGFRSTEETLHESLRWIEKVYPNEVEKIYGRIEQTVTEERNKLMGGYLNDEELFAAAMLEDPMDAIKQKYAEKPAILDALLSEIQEKTDAAQLNLMEEVLGNISIIDDSSIHKMNEELSGMQGEMDKLRKQNIKDDKQWQTLNKTLYKTQDLLTNVASPDYVESLMEQDRSLQELVATYENLRSELSFIQTADLTNSAALDDSVGRIQSYKDQLGQMLEEKIIDETLLKDNKILMDDFKELLNIQVSADLNGETSKLATINKEIGDINDNLGQVIDSVKDGSIKIDVEGSVDTDVKVGIVDIAAAIVGIDLSALTGGFGTALASAKSIFTKITKSTPDSLNKALGEDGTTPTGIFSTVAKIAKNIADDFTTTQLNTDMESIKTEAGTIADTLSGTSFKEKLLATYGEVTTLFNQAKMTDTINRQKLIGFREESKKEGSSYLSKTQAYDVNHLQLQVLMDIFAVLHNIDVNSVKYFTGVSTQSYSAKFATGGLIEDLAPISSFAPDSYDNRLLGFTKNNAVFANGREFILRESAVDSLGIGNIEYMNRYGDLPFNMLTDRYIPDFVMPTVPNLLNSSIKLNTADLGRLTLNPELKSLDSQLKTKESNNKTLDNLMQTENKTSKIEVLIKREDEKKQRRQKSANRPIIINYNGRQSSVRLTKEQIAVMESIAEQVSGKKIDDTISEFWEG